MRREPVVSKVEARLFQIAQHVAQIGGEIMRQHEAVVQRRSPASQRLAIRLIPEPRHERAHEQLLCETHPCVRRHLERAELQQPEPSVCVIGRVQLVDAELGPMRVAGDVHEQMAEDPIDQPRRDRSFLRELLERQFQFVECIASAFIDTRSLTRWPDELPRKDVRQGRVVVPIRDQAPQQIGPSQERAVGRSRSPQHNVIAATGPRMFAVELEFFCSESSQSCLVIDTGRDLLQLVPRSRWMHVDFDHAGVGSHLHHLNAMIGRRQITFQHHRLLHRFGGRFDHGDQLQIIVERLDRRHEDVQPTVARFDAHRGADDIRDGTARQAVRERGVRHRRIPNWRNVAFVVEEIEIRQFGILRCLTPVGRGSTTSLFRDRDLVVFKLPTASLSSQLGVRRKRLSLGEWIDGIEQPRTGRAANGQ